jgi:hypothetical protein
MQFKFVGRYTNGHTAITLLGVTFQGHEPMDVTDPVIAARLKRHPEFQVVHPLDHDGKDGPGGSLSGEKATRRRRKRKQVATGEGWMA